MEWQALQIEVLVYFLSVLKIFSNYTQIILLVTQIINTTFAAVKLFLLKCKGMVKTTKKEREARLQQMYGKCIMVEVTAINGGNLFDVELEPLENDQRESFIKDVRALLEKYFSGKYYDFEADGYE